MGASARRRLSVSNAHGVGYEVQYLVYQIRRELGLTDADGTNRWGIGTDPNIITASLKAVLGAAARARSEA